MFRIIHELGHWINLACLGSAGYLPLPLLAARSRGGSTTARFHPPNASFMNFSCALRLEDFERRPPASDGARSANAHIFVHWAELSKRGARQRVLRSPQKIEQRLAGIPALSGQNRDAPLLKDRSLNQVGLGREDRRRVGPEHDPRLFRKEGRFCCG